MTALRGRARDEGRSEAEALLAGVALGARVAVVAGGAVGHASAGADACLAEVALGAGVAVVARGAVGRAGAGADACLAEVALGAGVAVVARAALVHDRPRRRGARGEARLAGVRGVHGARRVEGPADVALRRAADHAVEHVRLLGALRADEHVRPVDRHRPPEIGRDEGRELGLLGPRPAAPHEHPRGAPPVVGRADDRRAAAHGDRGSEKVARGLVARRQLGLLAPGRSASREHVRGSGQVAVEGVVRGADDGGVPVERDRGAEPRGGHSVAARELGLEGPGAAVLHEHVRFARGPSGEGRGDDRGRAAGRHRVAEAVLVRAVRGRQLGLLRPGRAAPHERVRVAVRVAARALPRGADHRDVAAERDRPSERVARVSVARRELGLLGPGGAALHEDVRRAGIGVAGPRADERRGAVDRHREAEEVGRHAVARRQLLLLHPGGAALHEHVGGAGGADALRADDRGGAAQRHRVAERAALRELRRLRPHQRVDADRVARARVVDAQDDGAAFDLDPRAQRSAPRVERREARVPRRLRAARVAQRHTLRSIVPRGGEVALDGDLDRQRLVPRARRPRGEDEPLLHAERAVDVPLLAPARAPDARPRPVDARLARRRRHRRDPRPASKSRPAQRRMPGERAVSRDAERAPRDLDREPVRAVRRRRASLPVLEAIRPVEDGERSPMRRDAPRGARARHLDPRLGSRRRGARHVRAAGPEDGGHGQREHRPRRPRSRRVPDRGHRGRRHRGGRGSNGIRFQRCRRRRSPGAGSRRRRSAGACRCRS